MKIILCVLTLTLSCLAKADDYKPTKEELQAYFTARDSDSFAASNRSSTENSKAFSRLAVLAVMQSSLELQDADRAVFNRMLAKVSSEGASLNRKFQQGVCTRLLGHDVRSIDTAEFAHQVHEEEDKVFEFFGEQYRDLAAHLSIDGVQEMERVQAKHAQSGANRPRFALNQMFSGGSEVALYLMKENCTRRAGSEGVITGTTVN